MLFYSGIDLDFEGPCEDSRRKREAGLCACTRIYEPVCGKNGETYDNECTMECE